RAVIGRRRRHSGGSTGKVGELSAQLVARTSVRRWLYYCAGKSRSRIDGSGRCSLDRNQNLSTANCAGSSAVSAGLRGSLAERSGSHWGAASPIWRGARGPGNHRGGGGKNRSGTIHSTLSVCSPQYRQQRRTTVGSQRRTLAQSRIHLPVHSERADSVVEQALLSCALCAGHVGIRHECWADSCRWWVETEIEFRDRRGLRSGECERRGS